MNKELEEVCKERNKDFNLSKIRILEAKLAKRTYKARIASLRDFYRQIIAEGHIEFEQRIYLGNAPDGKSGNLHVIKVLDTEFEVSSVQKYLNRRGLYLDLKNKSTGSAMIYPSSERN